MSGHRSRRNNITPRNPQQPNQTQMTAVLDQLATDANLQRRNDPNMVALEPHLKALRAEYLRLCDHLDEVTAGAALLVVGQLLAAHVNAQPDADKKIEALAALPNLIRLVGAQLYAGTTTEVEIACPFTYLTGAPCTKTVAGATRGHAELLMKGHVWQHHPDEEWPPAEKSGGEITCSCGHTGCHDSANGGGDDCKDCTFYTSMLVGEDDAEEEVAAAVNLAPTDPAAQAAAMRDLEAEFPDGDGPDLCACGKAAELVVGELPKNGPGSVRSVCLDCARKPPSDSAETVGGVEKTNLTELINRASQTGQCPECDGWVYVEDGRIGFHPTGEDGNLRTCAGAGREPKADGEVEG